VVRGLRLDSKDALPHIRKLKKYESSGFSLNKAFVKEEIHMVIYEELRATIMIPPKKGVKTGKYRLRMQSLISKPKYHLKSGRKCNISQDKSFRR
jgi:hypothetical protein